MVRQRVRGNVVRLHKRGVQKITQRDTVAGLKADVVFRCANKRRLWDRNDLVEVP